MYKNIAMAAHCICYALHRASRLSIQCWLRDIANARRGFTKYLDFFEIYGKGNFSHIVDYTVS